MNGDQPVPEAAGSRYIGELPGNFAAALALAQVIHEGAAFVEQRAAIVELR